MAETFLQPEFKREVVNVVLRQRVSYWQELTLKCGHTKVVNGKREYKHTHCFKCFEKSEKNDLKVKVAKGA